MALTDKLTAIADAIRVQSGKTDKLTIAQMPDEIINLQSLNFEVVGNPQPSNPKVNTIWLNTDEEITGWAFSATEPDLVDGFVWIFTGTSSPVEFNALKKNGIQVYPLSAKQCVGGAWVTVTAMSCQNSGWCEWLVYLYNKGVEYVDENGNGWTFSGTYTKNEDNIRVGATGGTAYSGYAESGYIGMAGFNTVDVHIVSYQNSGTECYSNITIIDESGSTVIEQTIKNGTGSGEDIVVSVDISAVTSKCKVRLTAGHTRTGSGRAARVDFDIVRCY